MSQVHEHHGERRRVLRQGPEGVTFDLPDSPDQPAQTIPRGAWLAWTAPSVLLDLEGLPLCSPKRKAREPAQQTLWPKVRPIT